MIISRKRLRLITLFLPLLSFFIFVSIFGKGVILEIPIGVVNHDNSSISFDIVSALDSSPHMKVVQVSSLEEGKRLMRSASIYALVYMEKNMGIKAMSGQSPPVPFYYNNDYMSVSSTLLQEVTEIIAIESASILGSKLMSAGIPYDRLEGYLNPIAVEDHTLFNPYLSYIYYLAPSLLFTMLHFFVILSAIFTIGSELKEKTAMETYSLSGNNILVMILGKLLPYTVIYLLMAALVYWLIFGWIKMPFQGDIRIMAAATLLFILGYQAMGIVFIAMSGRLLIAIFSASFYASTAYTFIGMTFPYISLFIPAKIWAHLLPLYYFTEIFLGNAVKGLSLEQLAGFFICLCVFIILPFLLLFRIKKMIVNPKLYGDWGMLTQ